MIDNINDFSLWGGNNSYDIASETLTINRQYGLYSNIIISLFGVCMLKQTSYRVSNIRLCLNEYEHNYDFYNDFFQTQQNSFDISEEEANLVVNNLHPTNYGLSDPSHRFNKQKLEELLPILIKLYNKFYTINNDTACEIENIVNAYNIDYSTSAFVWARKTDKVIESNIPNTIDYIRQLDNTDVKKIYFQTDDTSVLEEITAIKTTDDRIVVLNELPISNDVNKGFHNYLYSISNTDFTNQHNMSKRNYLRKFLAITNIASKCNYFVSYPGNMLTIVPLMRQSFNNCILFIDNQNIA